ncbi:ArsR/SmtB family transcription factor [Microbulbifer taiwanensis]|uniref:ArsR/SmtB family transcription factor n=1 Tax=Microbulbifer taiwanensis TaxID=986746 RepID=A0ABW1YQC0_9GAMM|nr:helix-turn-helix domain-containing protein [Microbulbifer taiwanensis]
MEKKTIWKELELLRRRVEVLESGRPAAMLSGDSESETVGADRLWLLAGLRQQLEAPGGVAFGGLVDLPDGTHYEWQWGEKLKDRLSADWREAAVPLEALGHPVRLSILHSVLSGSGDIASLTELPELGTRGQLYHHLKSLENGGWIQPLRRGIYGVPAERIVPLLTVLAATSSP